MKKVEILVAGPYQKRVNKNKMGAIELEKGDVVEFEDAYADYLVGVELVKPAGVLKKVTLGAETVFAQDLNSDMPLVEQEVESRGRRGK